MKFFSLFMYKYVYVCIVHRYYLIPSKVHLRGKFEYDLSVLLPSALFVPCIGHESTPACKYIPVNTYLPMPTLRKLSQDCKCCSRLLSYMELYTTAS